jgi:hypothetical protein
MVCRVRLICRLPARESRWRIWSPDDASSGAVPFHGAKWPLVGKRVMSPTSISRRAAPDGPMPFNVSSEVPVVSMSSRSSLSAVFFRASVRSTSAMSSAVTRRRALPAASGGRTLASSALACGADRSFSPRPDELEQQVVQLRDHPGVVLNERPAPIGQDSQHGGLLVVDDRSQAGHAGADQCDRVRVGGVRLAAMTGGEDARSGRQLRRHVHHPLAVALAARGVECSTAGTADCPSLCPSAARDAA